MKSSIAEKIIIGNLKLTGKNKINVDAVCGLWDSLWLISEWTYFLKNRKGYMLLKHKSKYSSEYEFKTAILNPQAKEVIKRLNLKKYDDSIFTNGCVYALEEK